MNWTHWNLFQRINRELVNACAICDLINVCFPCADPLLRTHTEDSLRREGCVESKRQALTLSSPWVSATARELECTQLRGPKVASSSILLWTLPVMYAGLMTHACIVERIHVWIMRVVHVHGQNLEHTESIKKKKSNNMSIISHYIENNHYKCFDISF